MKKLTLKHLLLNGRLVLVLLLLAFFAGCSDDDDKTGSTAQPGTLSKLFTYPEIQGCQTCHYGGNTGPNLSKATFANNLVGKKSNQHDWSYFTVLNANCGLTTSYVDPNRKAINSSVLNSISQTYSDGSCVSAISYHAPVNATLTPKALTDFVLWIENGAPAN